VVGEAVAVSEVSVLLMLGWTWATHRTKRNLPFLVSCKMGLNGSVLEILPIVSLVTAARQGAHSILAFVQRGTSTIMLRTELASLAQSGTSWKADRTWSLPF
jgi:hypothetical protein